MVVLESSIELRSNSSYDTRRSAMWLSLAPYGVGCYAMEDSEKLWLASERLSRQVVARTA
jgi:hypothetical protein